MTNHLRKMIAPVIVVICISGYYIILGIFIFKLSLPVFIKLLSIIIPGLISLILIKVFIERIQEIRKGEEDDLGKY